MANEDDSVARSLPQPPPPAPARRDAAIREAMHRFDGGAPSRSGGVREERPSGFWSRPQLGVLAAASLVAVIGLPIAWVTVTQKTTPPMEMASRDTANQKVFDRVERAPAPTTVQEQAASPPVPQAQQAPPRPPPDAAARESGYRDSPVTAPAAQTSGAVMAEAPTESRASEAKRAEALAGASNRSETMPALVMAAPAAPPPRLMREAPAAAKPQQEMADAADSIVVTGAKARGRSVPDRGDWNACTIDDPRRSLAACKSVVDPAAKGVKGQAAAHIADGLSLAWQGHADRAIAAFDQAIAIAPKSAIAYLNRGLAWQRQGDSARALADLDQAVRITPNSARAYYNRGLLLDARGDTRRAKADYQRAADLNDRYHAIID